MDESTVLMHDDRNKQRVKNASMGWRTAGASLSLFLLVLSGVALVVFLVCSASTSHADTEDGEAAAPAPAVPAATTSTTMTMTDGDHDDRYLVGLSNTGGLGGNLQRLVCYAFMANTSGRRFVLVPQFDSEHYSHRRGEPALDYVKYMDASSFGSRTVNWMDAPEDVREFVALRGDRALFDSTTWNTLQTHPKLFRFGPGEDEHLEPGSGTVVGDNDDDNDDNDDDSGSDGDDAPTETAGSSSLSSTTTRISRIIDRDVMREIERRAWERTVVVATSRVNCDANATWFHMKFTPYAEKLWSDARDNLKSSYDRYAAGAGAGAGDGAGGGEDEQGSGTTTTTTTDFFSFSAVHWRRGDRCDNDTDSGVNVGPGEEAEDGRTQRCAQGGLSDRVMRLCADSAAKGVPLYIASDETDVSTLATWRSQGCLTWDDAAMGPRMAGGGADAVFVDVLLMARAESMYSLGASSLDAVVSRERDHAGKTPIVFL